jgi:hypothetical protein
MVIVRNLLLGSRNGGIYLVSNSLILPGKLLVLTCFRTTHWSDFEPQLLYRKRDFGQEISRSHRSACAERKHVRISTDTIRIYSTSTRLLNEKPTGSYLRAQFPSHISIRSHSEL